MADKSLYQLPSASDVGLTDLVYLEQVDEHAEEGFVTKNVQAAILGETIVSEFQYSSSGLVTEDKTIVGAINEIAEGGGGSASAFDIEFTSSPPMSIDKTASEVDDAYTNGDLMRVHTDLGNWLALISYREIDISGVLHHRYTFGNISGDGVTNFVMIDTAGSTIDLTYGGSSLAQIQDTLTLTASTWSSSKIHTETEAVKDYTDNAIYDILPTDTASGSIATFETSLALPLVSLTSQIVATQSGSGDPSPSNVRPISGFSEVTISHSDEDTSDPTTHVIDLGSTYYGGVLDVKRGVLKVTKRFIDLTQIEWEKNATQTNPNGTYYTASGDFSDCGDYATILSNVGVAGNGNIPTSPANSFWFNSARTGIRWIWGTASGGSSLSDLQNYLANNDSYLTVELTTPIEVTLDPEEVTALVGTNNIWADTGDIEVEFKVSIKDYIDNKLAEMSGNRSVTLNKAASLDVEKTDKEEKEGESDER